MWMLLGLVGIVMASGMVDLFASASQADGPLDDTGDAAADDAEGQGDLLDDFAPADGTGDPGDHGLDSLPGGPEEFISTDDPPPLPGNDLIIADEDGTPVMGGDGDDTLIGGGADDWLDGEGGDDSLDGGDGDDSLWGGDGDDTLIGGAGNDSLVSGGGAGLLYGGSGNDTLTGGADADTLFGGSGDDQLTGGYGDDVLVAGPGRDVLMGGGGDDTLVGFTPDVNGADIDGADFLNGGSGRDTIILGSGDVASGGEGNDTFVLGTWIDDQDLAVITDFSPGDGLNIAYDGTGPEPTVTASFDAERGGLVVLIDGAPVAVLTGVETLEAGSMTLLPVMPPDAPSG